MRMLRRSRAAMPAIPSPSFRRELLMPPVRKPRPAAYSSVWVSRLSSRTSAASTLELLGDVVEELRERDPQIEARADHQVDLVEGGQVLEAGARLLLGQGALGDVLAGAERGDDAPRLVPDQRVVPGDEPLGAVARQDGVLEVLHGGASPATSRAKTARTDARSRCGDERVEPVPADDLLLGEAEHLGALAVDQAHAAVGVEDQEHDPGDVEVLPGALPLLPEPPLGLPALRDVPHDAHQHRAAADLDDAQADLQRDACGRRGGRGSRMPTSSSPLRIASSKMSRQRSCSAPGAGRAGACRRASPAAGRPAPRPCGWRR